MFIFIKEEFIMGETVAWWLARLPSTSRTVGLNPASAVCVCVCGAFTVLTFTHTVGISCLCPLACSEA